MEAVLGDGEAICGTEHGEACLENEREISVWRVVCVCVGGASINSPQPWGLQARVAMVTASLQDRGTWRLERGLRNSS